LQRFPIATMLKPMSTMIAQLCRVAAVVVLGNLPFLDLHLGNLCLHAQDAGSCHELQADCSSHHHDTSHLPVHGEWRMVAPTASTGLDLIAQPVGLPAGNEALAFVLAWHAPAPRSIRNRTGFPDPPPSLAIQVADSQVIRV
jgi:hypothetical protein